MIHEIAVSVEISIHVYETLGNMETFENLFQPCCIHVSNISIQRAEVTEKLVLLGNGNT